MVFLLYQRLPAKSVSSIFFGIGSPGTLTFDDFVKSRNQTAKKKDSDARHANPEE
jgi:hypothetical protein